MNFAEIILICTIINNGIALGAGLYEARMVTPLWFNKQPDGHYIVNFGNMQAIDSGRKFWGFVTTGPLTLLMITNVVLAFQSQQPLHNWWVVAAIILLAERLATFTFFIPTAIKLQKAKGLPPAKTSMLVIWWMRVNYVRNGLTFAALLVFIKALLIQQTM